ncbi:MAG: anti-sigma factor [Cellulomonas sp.]
MVEHVDEEVLALIALGEPAGDDADRRHLAGCAECGAEVSTLAAVVAIGRSVTDADVLVVPVPAVWDRIRAELVLPAAATAIATATATVTATSAEAADEPAGPTPSTTIVPLRRRRAPWLAAAAAAGLIVGGVGGAWWAGERTGPAATAVVAEAALEPLPGWDASGTALVEKEPDGARVLVVTLDGGVQPGDFREVWLIDRDVQRLVSLGVLEGSTGRFTVPAGLDLTDFAVVDVSQEPFDGVPAHSGNSIVRGILGA